MPAPDRPLGDLQEEAALLRGQTHLQGADGPPEPGPQPAVQHQPSAHPRARHPEAPHPLLHDHPRVWVPRHRGRAHGHHQLHDREHQVPGQNLPHLWSWLRTPLAV